MRRLWGVAAVVAAVMVVGAGCMPAPPSGNPPPLTLFPSDALTVPDPAQATGKRVDLPKPADCVANKSECDEITLIDKLDGFDLDPAMSVHFAGAIDVAKVTDDSVYVEPTGGHRKRQDADRASLRQRPAGSLERRNVCVRLLRRSRMARRELAHDPDDPHGRVRPSRRTRGTNRIRAGHPHRDTASGRLAGR